VTEPGEEKALILGRLAIPGLAMALLGMRRRSKALVLVGSYLVGRAVRLVPRGRSKP
jgi:hypothetical protein